MKTILTSLLFSCCVLSTPLLHAQWTLLTSGTTNDLRDADFLDGTFGAYGVVVGDRGTALLTTNGGETWSDIAPTDTLDFHSVTVLSHDTILIAGGDAFENQVFRSTDGGATWEAVTEGFELAASPNGSWALSYQHLYTSADSGATWIDAGVPLGSTFVPEELLANGKRGQILGNISGIATYSTFALMTDNGGESWEPWFVFDLPNSDAFAAAAFPHEDTVFLFTNRYVNFLPGPVSHLVRMTDFSYDPSPSFQAWRFAADTIGEQLPAYPNQAWFFDGRDGYFAGDDGNLYRTENGGESWVAEYEGTQPIYGLTFTEGGDGYAVGAEGLIVRRIVFTNTDDPATVQALRLFPNPATDQVRVENWTETGTARLFDLQGRLLRRFVLQAYEPISLAGLVPGMYLLDLRTARAHYQARVVKQ